MKKLSFVLGSLFLAGAFMLPSFAHTFYETDHHDLAARPHTERIAPMNYYQQLYRDYYRCGVSGCNTDKRVNMPRQRVVDRNGRTIVRNINRQNINDTARRANTYQDRYIIVRKGNYIDRGYSLNQNNRTRNTYNVADAGDYELTNPRRFVMTENGDYRASGTTLAYRVLSLDQAHCNMKNFWTCAQSHNKAFRNSKALNLVRNVQTSYRWNQTAHTNFDYFPTITESFDAVVNGQAYTYYVYMALNPIDNTMIRIEGVSSSREKRTASQTAFQIFETFRFQ